MSREELIEAIGILTAEIQRLQYINALMVDQMSAPQDHLSMLARIAEFP